ncbi:MHYT domain-containing protein [Dactylosporangium matsuzakiense]|uniref:MHYT domain-containing signal sensor n=1 Tax=Dactylosporangium matsuzakiense TaxID=53360 RepID=A0A9W6KFI6_9ACTN|nr:MHYT domain-containing protein [Dactylosporangium matsuzakiense]UWZ42115.1 signal protein [Dactylosporangium matsuzakiense]GLK99744.1 MHYT domain-containing signal sensor [Dactylosporangium matsuzakiense]
MGQLHHFTYGAITPIFAFAMSFLGSLLGLVSTARARVATDNRRRAWLLVLAAWSIGGTGIWVMHFMAMVGFSVQDSPLRFDVPITVASFFIAVVTVGIGLFIVGMGERRLWKVFVGGPITGVSVAFMHYTGMAAMNVDGSFEYRPALFIASYAIAIVAATVALWFTVVVRGMVATTAAATLMGVAVCAMHYTGMYSMEFHLQHSGANVPGVDVNWFLAPIVLFVLVVVIALASAVMAVPSEREQAEAEAVREKIAQGRVIRENNTPVFGGGPIGDGLPASGPAGSLPQRSKAAQAFGGRADARRDRGR